MPNLNAMQRKSTVGTDLSFVQRIQKSTRQLNDHALVGQTPSNSIESSTITHTLPLCTLTLHNPHSLLFLFALDNILQVLNQLLPRLHNWQCYSNMDSRWCLERIQMPSLGTHCISDIIDIQCLGCECHN